MSGLVVGCYTPGAYEAVAYTHLIPSVTRLGLASMIREIPDRGSWILNNSACQLYLRGLHNEFPDVDFLYVDVDGEIHRDPWEHLDRLRESCDVGAHYFRGVELLSGTLYLPGRDRRRHLLDDWNQRNAESPDVWDQKVLQRLLEEPDSPYRLARLPAEYCCIFDLQRKVTPAINPVIEHFQASRQHKKGRRS